MTDQTLENTESIKDNFIILAMFVREIATVQEVEAINEWLLPLNQAIMNRIGPPAGTVKN